MEIQSRSGFHEVDEKSKRKLFYSMYTPEDGIVTGTLLVIHGMQEHSGRYSALAEYFAGKGFAVLTYDHQGHGKSIGADTESGFFRLNQPHELLISDAEHMSNLLNNRSQDVPHFVLGHSMGSFVTRCLLQRSASSFGGAIIVGTGARLPGIGLLKSYFSIANRLNPRRKPGFNHLFSHVNNMRFRRDRDFSTTSWLSMNPDNRTAFEQDALCGLPFSNNGYLGLFSLYEAATSRYWFKNIPKSLPLLFVSGANDPIGDFGKGVRSTADILKTVQFQDVSVQLYRDMRHEILNESIRQEVFGDIHTWISARQ